VLCGCVGVCTISAQIFETGVFMFELSWSKAYVAPCPNPSHSVPTLYPYFQAHAFNSPFKRALVLVLFYSYPFSYYYYPLSSSLHPPFPPHPQPLVQLSSSNGCEVTPTSVFQNLSIISVLQIESNLLVLGMTIPSTKQLHLSATTALCIYSTPSLSY